ncbi:type I-F CRISPR-associated endoribonuclease Cas6/Csy4 [Photobacterium sp. SDRW27]|uniref:type I-F CRISPR-associated endoribonuclease Cas6/Csy4 n=1 Tax=Photobacterium obscurum TaxID=2829490 RepID=UPI00224447DA|nr:type I-F CRISPR-associated endoribonuclease Cas6/Csy4 [Photobacterium obscurum]MCW8331438.1 type I-F CRISPR-associated endoribonuclease Cas6/Csy4 [Photobacterium obscurum]
MQELLFRTVKFLPVHKNNEALALRCIKAVHGFCTQYRLNDIAISFPNWSYDTVGDKLTLVSVNPLHLDSLLNQHYFNEMVIREYFSISELRSVPPNTGYAYFFRNQAIDNAFPNADTRKQKRLEKRAASRGEDYQSNCTNQTSPILLQHYHTLKISSKSNGNPFRLNIQRELTTYEPPGTVTSYGLSNKSDKRFAVPLI